MTVDNQTLELVYRFRDISEKSMFLVLIIIVWRWNFLGVVLAVITDLVILTIPDLLRDTVDPPTVHDMDWHEYWFATIGTGIFIYGLFILMIKSIFRRMR